MNKISMWLFAMGFILLITPAFAEETTPVVTEGVAPAVADGDSAVLEAKASAAFWGAKLAYEKLQRLNNSFPNEDVSVVEPEACNKL